MTENGIPKGVELLDWHKEEYEASQKPKKLGCSTDLTKMSEFAQAYLDGCVTAREFKWEAITRIDRMSDEGIQILTRLLASTTS